MSAAAPRLGERLVAAGVIGADQLEIALREQKASPEPLGRILVRLGLIGEAVLREQLGQAFGQESIDLARVVPEPAALAMVPRAMARRHRLLPIAYREADGCLEVAMAEPADLVARDRLRAQTGAVIHARVAGDNEIAQAIDAFYGHEHTVDGILRELEGGGHTDANLQEAGADYDQPLVRLVDALLADAVRHQASDIHLEPEPGFVRIRYRIDGVLHTLRSLHADHAAPVCVRLKVMAGMDIAETRMPQDGRISRWIGGRSVDFRISTMPTLHGENLVLRVLDRGSGLCAIDCLGLAPAALEAVRMMLLRPEGLILVTGPTGSGKTTTLYSMLAESNREAVNIVTLEDPVEYPLTMIRQTPVRPEVGLDFARGVRSLMRQDPDIMLIGEIRDRETADMALRAAMTGHQVLATVHASSALRAVPRLLEIGLPAGLLAGNITGVIGQRLVRRLCPHCRVADEPGPRERRLLAGAGEPGMRIHRPAGCARCRQQGYAGRLVLFEVLRIDADLDAAIDGGAHGHALEQLAVAGGFVDLATAAMEQVRKGTTALEEVARVIDLTRGAAPAAAT